MIACYRHHRVDRIAHTKMQGMGCCFVLDLETLLLPCAQLKHGTLALTGMEGKGG